MSEKHLKALKRFQKAVMRATFLEDDEKENWIAYGFAMEPEELAQAEVTIIQADLEQVKIKKSLQKLQDNK